jgi:hypothetical protein
MPALVSWLMSEAALSEDGSGLLDRGGEKVEGRCSRSGRTWKRGSVSRADFVTGEA